LVLLHGVPKTAYSWHKLMPLLAPCYTVVARAGYTESRKVRYLGKLLCARAGRRRSCRMPPVQRSPRAVAGSGQRAPGSTTGDRAQPGRLISTEFIEAWNWRSATGAEIA
jgi:hypothetical protein